MSLRANTTLPGSVTSSVDFSVATELVAEPGSVVFALNDTLTNNGDYAKEYQALYHSNFSTPFLEQGAKFAAPVKQVSPFNDKAKGDLPDWQTYRAPTKDYDETVYNVVPYANAKGETLTVLHNKAGSLGVSVGFNTQQLPVFFHSENTGNCWVLKPTATPRLPALLCSTVRVSPLASAYGTTL